MEKGQSEVTNKIRSAIKKKLAEISEFVDDDLPEYIMILVANQRSKSQIAKDLSLFLRDDTEKFTDWLWDLLNNLKVGFKTGLSSTSKNESNRTKRKEVDADEDAVVLDCDPDEDDRDFLSHDDTNDSSASKIILPQINSKAHESGKEESTLRSNNSLEKDKNDSKCFEASCKAINDYKEHFAFDAVCMKKRKAFSNNNSKEPLSSAVVSVKKHVIDVDDEYDPTKPEYISSPSSTAKRRYGGPSALQANKLLLKAVDDATKSILDGKSIEDYYKPTPIKVLTSKRHRFTSRKRDDSVLQETSDYNVPEPDIEHTKIPEFNDEEFSSSMSFNDSYINDSASQKSRTICLRPIPLISNSPERVIDKFTPSSSLYSLSAVEDVRPKSPHFIVTLEGVNLSSFKRKRVDSCSESVEEEDANADETVLSDAVVNTSPEKKQKLSERCKYWPACKNSDHCSYHHPTIPCKSFPDCKFGDKCLYIHPNCKFDALCSRKDCPYTHASKRKLPLTTVPLRMIPMKTHKMKPVCKFYPKCASKNCPFIHPKLCRYGTDCRLPTCLFGHFPVPSRSQMKWQAAVS